MALVFNQLCTGSQQPFVCRRISPVQGLLCCALGAAMAEQVRCYFAFKSLPGMVFMRRTA